MIGIGLAVAFTAHAHSNNAYLSGYGESANLNLLHESTLYNTSGYPNEEDWEAKRLADEKAKSRYLAKNTGGYSWAIRCSCVLYAKSITGFNTPIGLAKYWPVNLSTPRVGAVVITGGTYTGHVAVITEIQGTKMKLTESNYTRCAVTHNRWIDMNDTNIIGYWIK